MQIKTKNNFYRLGVVAAVAAITSMACNNSDYKTSDNTTAADSGSVANPAAASTPAGDSVDSGPRTLRLLRQAQTA